MAQVSRKDYRVILDTLTLLDCPRSLTVAVLFRYGEFEQIVNLSFDALAYNTLQDARSALCSTDLLKKNRFLPIPSIDKNRVALNGFLNAEASCRETNDRLLRGNPDYDGLLWAASRKIANVLGVFDPGELVNLSGWGPGVTLSLRSGNNTLFEKFRHDGEVTPNFYRLSKLLCDVSSPYWSVRPRVYEGNRVITVPKNAKTDRVIAVEPSLNLFFQKGVGAMIRKRLKRWGIDLNTQVRNQELSRSGSFSGSLATVDFSSASDTISYRLVMDLLPWNWFEVLDVLRSPRGMLDDELLEYEKFSSMGNGFTFELESLIFWALARAVAEEQNCDASEISVFGDDVIIPTVLYERYSQLCSYAGFTVNKTKSFSTSYFRESCGGYFWNGVSIKPVRLIESLASKEASYSYHNRLKEYDSNEAFDKLFSSLRAFLRNSVKNPCFVPPSYGDSGFRLTKPRGFYSTRSGEYRFRYLSSVSDTETADDHAVLLTQYWLNHRAGLDEDCIYRYQSERAVTNVIGGSRCRGNDADIPRSGRRVVKTARLSYWC
jgi:hypothetical protein